MPQSTLILLFVIAIVLQIAAASMLPATRGFMALIPTATCLVFFGVSFWMMARLMHSGVNLSIIAPIMAAIVPLGAIATGILVYGEPAPAMRIGLLVSACALIGFASTIR
jgi:multidrug transporter EmrE-like cation transporter